MEWRRRGGAELFLYRHTEQIGYRVPCPNRPPLGSCCVLCRDSGEIGFFRAERMEKAKGKKA